MDRYLWIVVTILLIAILLCLIVKNNSTYENNMFRNIKFHTDNGDEEIDNYDDLISKDFYGKIEKYDFNDAVNYLKRKCVDAQKIVPQFPEFPCRYTQPPTNKGKHSSMGERYCIEFLESVFPNNKFTKIRPKWIRNPKTNRPLELDGFCKDLMIAVEYQGIQHYVWPNFTKCSRKDFSEQQYRDQYKVDACINNNVCLIRIPYTVPTKKIPLAIYAKLLDAVPGLNY